MQFLWFVVETDQPGNLQSSRQRYVMVDWLWRFRCHCLRDTSRSCIMAYSDARGSFRHVWLLLQPMSKLPVSNWQASSSLFCGWCCSSMWRRTALLEWARSYWLGGLTNDGYCGTVIHLYDDQSGFDDLDMYVTETTTQYHVSLEFFGDEKFSSLHTLANMNDEFNSLYDGNWFTGSVSNIWYVVRFCESWLSDVLGVHQVL